MGSGVQLQRLHRRRGEAFPPSVEVDCPNCRATSCPEGDWEGLSAEAVDDGRKEGSMKNYFCAVNIRSLLEE